MSNKHHLRIAVILHAGSCRNKECPKRWCKDALRLLYHLKGCKGCSNSHCRPTREALSHYHTCKSCAQCMAIRASLQQVQASLQQVSAPQVSVPRASAPQVSAPQVSAPAHSVCLVPLCNCKKRARAELVAAEKRAPPEADSKKRARTEAESVAVEGLLAF